MNLLSWAAYATAVGLLLLVAAWLLERLFISLRWPSRGIWMATLLLLCALPLSAPLHPLDPPAADVSVFLPVHDAPGGVAATGTAFSVQPDQPSPPYSAPAPQPRGRLSPDELLVAGWLLLSGSLALAISIAYVAFRRRRGRWSRREVDGRLVWVASDVGPAAVGVLRGRIVLPDWVLSIPAADRELILAHEEEHVRAGDPRLLATVLVAGIALPWNPAIWVLWRALRRAIEIDCDGRVLRRGFDARRYGKLLIDVTERGTAHRFAVAAPAESVSFLERRISLMISQPSRLLRPRAAAALVLAMGAVLTAFRLPQPRQEPLPLTGFALRPAEAARPDPAPVQLPESERQVEAQAQVRDFGPTTPENEDRLIREMLRSIIDRHHPELLQGDAAAPPRTLHVLVGGNGTLVRSALATEERGGACFRGREAALGMTIDRARIDYAVCGYRPAGVFSAVPFAFEMTALKPESDQQRRAPTGDYPISHIFHRGRPAAEVLTELVRRHHPDVYQNGLPEGETLWAVGNDANEIVRSGRQWGWAGQGAARDAIREMVPDLHIGDIRLTSVISATGSRIPVAWMRILPPEMSIANEGREPYPQARTFGVSTSEPGRTVEVHFSGPAAEDLGRFRFSRGSKIIDGVLTATTPFSFVVLDDQPFQATLRLQGRGTMVVETEGERGVRVRQQLSAISLRRGTAGDEITMLRGENARRLIVQPGVPVAAMVGP